ncbi:sarcosine oxidase subunit gamma family protein [Mesorhizobium sp. KR9-304]|uniref:sarcosine oxidase subunit gamma n=1 Tax=Mesorhizobium sp. KR9-304 TaxID=3156614 RepID=UPI0032B5DF74
MIELNWIATTPLSRIYAAGRHGAKGSAAGLAMAELTDFELVQVMARRGMWSAADQACRDAYRRPAPAKPQAVEANGALLIWSGPDQFLVLSARGAGSALEKARLAFAGMASLSEQSDGRSLIRVSGPQARDMLAKVCSLDLHPAVFPAGTAAATSIDHTSVNLWRGEDSSDAAVFYLLVFATFAESLWHTLLDSGAEYGVTIDTAGAWQG